MQGLPGDDTEGLIPRSIKKILDVTKGAAQEGWQYTLEASFLEIYNEVTCRAGVPDTITWSRIPRSPE